jgi:hypothetical protein
VFSDASVGLSHSFNSPNFLLPLVTYLWLQRLIALSLASPHALLIYAAIRNLCDKILFLCEDEEVVGGYEYVALTTQSTRQLQACDSVT